MTFPATTPGSAPVPSNGKGANRGKGTEYVVDIAHDRDYRTNHPSGRSGEIFHHYGDHVHLLDDPLAMTWLARAGSPDCCQPELGNLVRQLYRRMVHHIMAAIFPTTSVQVETRMVRYHWPEGVYRGMAIDPKTMVTVVDVARAGMLPSQECFDAICKVLDPHGVHQDHLMMQRETDFEGHVTGANLSGCKFSGHGVGNHFVLFPDPMGATGSSLVRAVKLYTGNGASGAPRTVLTLNMIVTPEFIRKITDELPGVQIWAWRLDRGLSPSDILRTPLGLRWHEERGLNDMQYIVPGAGGMGEELNHALS